MIETSIIYLHMEYLKIFKGSQFRGRNTYCILQVFYRYKTSFRQKAHLKDFYRLIFFKMLSTERKSLKDLLQIKDPSSKALYNDVPQSSSMDGRFLKFFYGSKTLKIKFKSLKNFERSSNGPPKKEILPKIYSNSTVQFFIGRSTSKGLLQEKQERSSSEKKHFRKVL